MKIAATGFVYDGRDAPALSPWKESGTQILVCSSILSFISRAGGEILSQFNEETS